jgi:hypothetical protein
MPSLRDAQYHDLEKRSLPIEHSEAARLNIRKIRIADISEDTTLDGSYDLVNVDCTGGVVTITLPPAASYPFKQYMIKKVDESTNPVKVVPDPGEYIDWKEEWLINYRGDCMGVVSDAVDEWEMN